MPQVAKIATPGYNALTDTDPDHFALYVDQKVDYVLIKEKTRGNITVGATDSETVAHGLGYVPFILAFFESSAGTFRKIHGATDPASSSPYFEVDSTNLTLWNTTGSSVDFSYYIFYDNIT